MLKLLFSCYIELCGIMEGIGCVSEGFNFNLGIVNLLVFYCFFKGNVGF